MEEFDLDLNENIGTKVNELNLDYVSDRKYKEDKLNKKDLGINQLARSLELKLDKYDQHPVMEESEVDNSYKLPNFKNFKHYDLVFYVFFFIFFNTNFVIKLINNNISNIKKINNSTGNLSIRTLLFCIMIYVIKKLN